MEPSLIIAIVIIAGLLLIGLAFLLPRARRNQEARNHERARETLREADLHSTRAEREQAIAEERLARARLEQVEAEERAAVAEREAREGMDVAARERAEAQKLHERAEQMSPDLDVEHRDLEVEHRVDEPQPHRPPPR